jgi:lysophospholipase L1-like esterase
MKKIVLFQGDSITDGNRYKEKNQEWDLNHQIGHSYVYIVNGILGNRFPEKDLKFINRGISGNKIEDIFSRKKSDIIDIDPDILSVLVGVNDALFGFNDYSGTDPGKFETVYRMLLDEVIKAKRNIRIVLCEPFTIRLGQTISRYDSLMEYMVAYQRIVSRIALDYNAIFIELQKKFDEACKRHNPEYWIWDGIHPTENGHGLIADEWIRATKQII